MINKRIGIIGTGNMGEALIKGLVSVGMKNIRNIIATDTNALRKKCIAGIYGIKFANSNLELAKKSDVIILAVKPKEIPAVLDGIKSAVNKNRLIISIAAGITTRFLEKRLNKASVVRVMPNMPALVCKGMSAITKGRFATKSDLKIAEEIFSSVGEVVEVKEKHMDIVTAISGSGPAYFFLLIDSLIKAAKSHGLSNEIATKLAIQTAQGAAELVSSTGISSEILINRVASKGGTTEAALEVFKNKNFKKIVELAVGAAAKRSKQLAR